MIRHICIYNSVPFALKIQEMNNSKVLHEQISELVFHVYQYFKKKVWALEGGSSQCCHVSEACCVTFPTTQRVASEAPPLLLIALSLSLSLNPVHIPPTFAKDA